MKKTIALSLLFSSILSVAASAQDSSQRPRPRGEEILKKLDTDGDGKVSKPEAEQAEMKIFYEQFSEIDTNADNYLTAEELNTFLPKRKGRGERNKEK